MSKSHCCQVKLEPILTGITPPNIIKTAVLPGERAETLFLATCDGEISTVEPDSDGWCLKRFLAIQDLITERGLHGLEFHPRFFENGRFFLHYSMRDSGGESYNHSDTIEEWILPETKVPICIRTLLNLKWPFSNHTGSNTLSWADGCLILLTGDGGSEYDPFNHAQSNTSLLGKVIAINVDYRPWKYTKNPVPVSEVDQLDSVRRKSLRIVAKGLQDPSGFEVDGPVKYLSDSGLIEKITAFTRWKRNFGWRAWDGPTPTCGHRGNVLYHDELLDLTNYDRPMTFYRNKDPSSKGIIGGCVYHGEHLTELKDHYIFADSSGDVFTFQKCNQEEGAKSHPLLLETGKDDLTLTALGANHRRTRLFVGGYEGQDGGLYELVA